MLRRIGIGALVFGVLLGVAAPCFADKQDKGAVGAGLLTGGAAVIVGLGTFGFGGVLFGAFGAGFQVGYGTGMVAKSVAEAPTPDPAFNQAVVLAPLNVAQLPDSALVAANLANPANAAMQDIASFDANIRAYATAHDRYLGAVGAGDASAALSQLISASHYFNAAQISLSNTSADLAQLQTALGSDPIGALLFDVPTLYNSVQTDLINNGFPASEQAYLMQFQTSANEQNLFITRLAGLDSSAATGYYGSTITFQNLVGEVGNNAGDIATNLSGLLNFSPVPEPSTFGMAVAASLAAIFARRRSRFVRGTA
jgi:hypothetical protein